MKENPPILPLEDLGELGPTFAGYVPFQSPNYTSTIFDWWYTVLKSIHQCTLSLLGSTLHTLQVILPFAYQFIFYTYLFDLGTITGWEYSE